MRSIILVITLVLLLLVTPSNSYQSVPINRTVGIDSVKILKAQLREKDSILYLWLNDYTYRVRVISGIEKDEKILKYELWNIRNKKNRVKKK